MLFIYDRMMDTLFPPPPLSHYFSAEEGRNERKNQGNEFQSYDTYVTSTTGFWTSISPSNSQHNTFACSRGDRGDCRSLPLWRRSACGSRKSCHRVWRQSGKSAEARGTAVCTVAVIEDDSKRCGIDSYWIAYAFVQLSRCLWCSGTQRFAIRRNDCVVVVVAAAAVTGGGEDWSRHRSTKHPTHICQSELRASTAILLSTRSSPLLARASGSQ